MDEIGVMSGFVWAFNQHVSQSTFQDKQKMVAKQVKN